MGTTALGIAPDSDGNGVTPLTHRLVQRYQYENTGIIGGLEVSGGTGLTYTIAEGVAVVSRGDSDGYALAYYEGGTVSTTAGSSSNPRYDVIWIRANDISQGDDDNLVEVGVTSGSAASSPSVPDLEDGCTEIDRFYVPAGMTATSSCTSQNYFTYAVPYGAASGCFGGGDCGVGTDKISTSSTTIFSETITLPTDRYVEVKFLGRTQYGVDPDSDYYGDDTGSVYAGVYVSLYIDGELKSDAADCIVAFRLPARCLQVWRLGLSKGSHTFTVKTKSRSSLVYWADICEVWIDDAGVMA